MREQPSTGKRRSRFKVLVNLDEHPTPEDAATAWTEEVSRPRRVGRNKRADRLENKLSRLEELA